MISLKRKTAVDDLIESVPRPERGVPQNSLPGWEKLPLDSKLPMLKFPPNNKIIFSRSKIGQKLWKSTPADFVLTDPNCYNVSYDYDPLHDPHLKHFFQMKNNVKGIKKLGIITENNDVICSLKEYNQYRKYLKRLHLDAVLIENKRREVLAKDKQNFIQAELITLKNQKMQEKREMAKNDMSEGRLERLKKEKEKRDRMAMTMENYKRNMDRIEESKQIRKRTLEEISNLKTMMRWERIGKVEAAKRRRIIALKKKWRTEDLQRKQNREWIQMEELKKKENIAALSWELKLCWREMKFSENQKTMEDYEKAMAHNVKRHNEIIHCKWEQIDYEIQLKRKERSRNKNKTNNALQSRTVDIDNSKLCTTSVLSQAKIILNQASDEVRINGKDFSKDQQVFSHVFNEIKLVFDYVEGHILSDVRKILNATKHSRENLLEAQKRGENSKTSYKSSKGTLGNSPTLTRSVSFGKFVSIGQSDQILEKGVTLKKASDRIPTPTASLTSVQIVVQNTPNEDEQHTNKNSLDNLTLSEKLHIEHQILKFRKHLLKKVEQRTFAGLDLDKMKVYMKVRQEIKDFDRNYLINSVTKSLLTNGHNNDVNLASNLQLSTNVLCSNLLIDIEKMIEEQEMKSSKKRFDWKKCFKSK